MDLLKADLLDELGPLLSAEAAAEAPGAGVDPADLEQSVWVRLLESGPGPPDPTGRARWLRRAVRAEARRARRRARREIPYGSAPADAGGAPEDALMHGEANRALRSAVARLPGRCPELMGALLSPRDLTYREIAGELGISQGSLGPVRSRCLGCLRRMLAAEVAAPGLRGKER
ncbi:RNA polymerase sigma factor [Streptomyces subrutilus]|uniref:RNA polymerase sigma factor n=1 Tax=Streptomyces subrutilus TaxID=36818 RepID=A0A5P2UV57_9ACTN|nr:sigma-70 family RNA polymerase sigma factor [Streptomyces subrutilus]QEU81401.1 sigma-70 family RNA polymerase sigma factor [Streptomyces subrutilus]GGZ87689.1 RNA polymerase sigma factor [Streptomyces subrutilus]